MRNCPRSAPVHYTSATSLRPSCSLPYIATRRTSICGWLLYGLPLRPNWKGKPHQSLKNIMARLFTLASDETLASMISGAKDRLVIVKHREFHERLLRLWWTALNKMVVQRCSRSFWILIPKFAV